MRTLKITSAVDSIFVLSNEDEDQARRERVLDALSPFEMRMKNRGYTHDSGDGIWERRVIRPEHGNRIEWHSFWKTRPEYGERSDAWMHQVDVLGQAAIRGPGTRSVYRHYDSQNEALAGMDALEGHFKQGLDPQQLGYNGYQGSRGGIGRQR